MIPLTAQGRIEIERKFLVLDDGWRASVTSRRRYRQGYLLKTRGCSVRVRRWAANATLTVKTPRQGIIRAEFEYSIPLDDAEDMLRRLCAQPLIEKTRHFLEHAGLTWEVDVYQGAAAGLVVAEVELDRPDQPLLLPEWIGAEVTHDRRFRNSAIGRGAWRKAKLRRPKASVDRMGTALTPPAPALVLVSARGL